jgi:hypothetical protein
LGWALAGVPVLLSGPLPRPGCKGQCLMQRPLVAPALSGTARADSYRALLEKRCPLHHCQQDVTGLTVLAKTSLAPRTQRVRGDTTTCSRCFSAAPSCHDHGNERRVASPLQQTKAVRKPTRS